VAFWREVKRQARAAVLPGVFVCVSGYFAWNAVQGDRGMRMAAQRHLELQARQAELARVTSERDLWERRVGSLRSDRIDRDMLDERARAMLNLADPDDVIVQYGPKDRLF